MANHLTPAAVVSIILALGLVGPGELKFSYTVCCAPAPAYYLSRDPVGVCRPDPGRASVTPFAVLLDR